MTIQLYTFPNNIWFGFLLNLQVFLACTNFQVTHNCTDRDNIAIGVTARDREIIAMVNPGASRSNSGRVA